MNKFVISILLFLISISIVSAELCPNNQKDLNTNCSLTIPVWINFTAIEYKIYDVNATLIANGTPTTYTGNTYKFDIKYNNGSNLNNGDYVAQVYTDSVLYGTKEVLVRYPKDNNMIGLLFLIPLIFGIGLMYGAKNLVDEEHKFLKLFVFLLSFAFFFASLSIGLSSVAQYLDSPNLQSLLSHLNWIVTIIFCLILFYFAIYYLFNITKKKNEYEQYED